MTEFNPCGQHIGSLVGVALFCGYGGKRCSHCKHIAELESVNERLREMMTPYEDMDSDPWEKVERIARRILARHYPRDIFTGESGDPGPRITAALHDALAEIDAPTPTTREAD